MLLWVVNWLFNKKMVNEVKITDKDRQEIFEMAKIGMRKEDIALIKKIAPRTLQRRCQEELKAGRAFGKHKIQESAFYQAVEQKNTIMSIFLLKTKCGYRERPKAPFDSKPLPALPKAATLPVDPVEASKIYQKIMSET